MRTSLSVLYYRFTCRPIGKSLYITISRRYRTKLKFNSLPGKYLVLQKILKCAYYFHLYSIGMTKNIFMMIELLSENATLIVVALLGFLPTNFIEKQTKI